MAGKAFFIDTSLCIGCRGCQIACKQWNELPGTKTTNWGSFQNPKDLSPWTYKLVRFSEHLGQDNKPVWYFFPEQCRHCLEPPCKEVADSQVKGGIVIDEATGAVIYTEALKKAKAKEIIDACPFNVPRVDEKSGLMTKCTMCIDRVSNGLVPACVKTCITGAMNFGDREKMVELAKKRLQEVKAKYPKAQVTGLDDLRVFYLLLDEPKKYYEYAQAQPTFAGIDRSQALRRMVSELGGLAKALT